MSKMAYVPGPITAPTLAEQRINVIRAAEVAARLMGMGYQVFCPHTHSEALHELQPMDWEYWMELDLRILRHCDLVVCAPGWRESKGARVEVEAAHMRGIPIYTSVDLVPPIDKTISVR